MKNNFNSDMSIDYDSLDKQYPGIKCINIRLDPHQWKNLQSLANLIKYNVPKAYYTQQIIDIDEKIQQIYFQYHQRRNRNFDQIQDQPAEIVRKQSQLSDQQQAQVIRNSRKQMNILPQKFSITEISQFISNFKKDNDSQSVNPNIISTVFKLQGCRRQKAIHQIIEQKQKQRQNEKRTKNYNKYKEGGQKRERPKNQITIIMGDKIPIQVKQTRNCIKKASLDSFAVTSIELQKQKTQIEKYEILISLNLNKVVQQNMNQIYLDTKQLIVQNRLLAECLIKQLINKCLCQFKMISVYSSFICLFTKIPNKNFSWSYQKKHSKMNHFHCLFIQKLHQVFIQLVQDQSQSKKIKPLCCLIGNLILERKLSKRIYMSVNNIIISKIMEQYDQKGKITQQNYFQAAICLIESLDYLFNDIQEQIKIDQMLSPINHKKIQQIIEQPFPKNMEQLLHILNDRADFSTIRIKCLIKNLFQRKHNEDKVLNMKNITSVVPQKSSVLSYEQIKQIINQQKGLDKIISIYEKEKCSKLLEHLLIFLCEGAHQQVISNMKEFALKIIIPKKQFISFWEKAYINFIFSESDFPFMTSGIGLLMNIYLGKEAERCIILAQQQNEDQEDINYFMKKLSKKISQFSNFCSN